MEDYPPSEILSMERDILGFYISGHPMEVYRSKLDRFISHHLAELDHAQDGESVVVAGIATNIKTTVTKRKEMMAYLTLEDTTGSAEVLVFPKTYNQYSHLLEPEKVLLVKATLRRQEEELKLSCEAVQEVDDTMFENQEQSLGENLLLKLPECEDINRLMLNLRGVFSRHSGGCPVYLDFGNGEVLRIDGKLWVNISQDLVSDLSHLCGADNIILG